MVNKEIMFTYFEAFIPDSCKYALLDDDGNIRATSFYLQGCVEAQKGHGWGTVHHITVTKKAILIGDEVQ